MKRRLFLQHSLCTSTALSLGLPLAPSLTSASPTSQPASPSTTSPLISPLGPLLKVAPKDVRYRIALVTDPHLAMRDKSFDFKVLRYSPFLFEQHISLIRHLGALTGRKADLLLIAGDLTRDSEPWNHHAVIKTLRSLPMPSLVIPGNHDVFKKWMTPANWGIEKFVAHYQGRYGGYQGKAPYYAHEVTKGLVVIGLNSSDTPDGALRTSWNGRLDPAQLLWFKRTLQAHAGKKLVLVMVHHNLLHHHPANREDSKSAWKNFHMDNADEVLSLMAKYGATLAITGHHHINHIAKHPSLPVTEICTSGACSYPSNIRILDISSDLKHLHVHTVGVTHQQIMARIALAAKRDPFWKLPDKPKDMKALFSFLEGTPKDRENTLSLPSRSHFL